MKTKKCIGCKQVKNVSEFYTSNGYYQSYCKDCKREQAYKFRDTDQSREHMRLYMREYRKTHKRIRKPLSVKQRTNQQTSNSRYRTNPINKIKRNAQQRIATLIRSERLKREPCFLCGDVNTEAHHPNYGNPLYIIFLCKSCHEKIHSHQ
jgi:hypothetical protein